MRYIAFLRGINVSGQKLLKMEELRKHFQLPGFDNIVSYIQSGNILFDTEEKNVALLRQQIEKQLAKKTGHEITVVLRTLPEIKKTIKNNPFKDLSTDDVRKVYVSFLADAPKKEVIQTLETFSNDKEQLKVIAKEVYLLTTSYGDTKFSNTFVEKKTGIAATTRNWATVNKVLDL